ncbi:right-handed parallel beta-helix repeat-containing protein [Microlunatus sp. GCM10028923]|uniref:right-handed parallel beta-helix repeat-containing protein n=1 Tax=Microlunatus sp. GCM10028923 TaxID=3273400 RepID=UPI003621DB08
MRNRIAVMLALVLLLGLPVATARAVSPQLQLYVAPNGDDRAAGGVDQPLRTLEAARDRIRTVKEGGGLPKDGATVFLREGSYPRSASFTLTEADSGTASAPVVYRSYPGETARLSGGTDLDRADFAPETDPAVLDRIIDPDARAKVLKFDLAGHGLTDYGEVSRHGYWKASELSKLPPMELYVDDKAMTLARWPNEGTVQMDKIIDPGPTVDDPDLHDRGGTFSYTYDRPALWTEAEDAWLDGIFSYSWEWSYNKINSIDPVAKTITLRYGEMSGLQKSWYPDFHFAENLLEELDRAGEYYIDRERGVLYLMPNQAFTDGSGDVTVTTLRDPMVITRGTSHVRFEGLTFEFGRDAGLVITGGEQVVVKGSDIVNFSNGGVRINAPTQFMAPIPDDELDGVGHLIDSSELRHLGALAVQVNGGDKTTLAPGRNEVRNSHLHDFAYYNKAYNPGISLSGVGNRAVGNEINDAPHPGILIYGNDHLVEYNEIYDICTMFSDLGAIYMNAGSTPQERGTVIRRNYFHDIGEGNPGVEGVYPDNFTMGLTIEENIFQDLANSAVKNNAGSYINTRNNLFIDTYVPMDNYELFLGDQPGNKVDESYMEGWRKLFADTNNFEGTPYLEEYPELATFFEENRYYPDTNTFAKNVVYNPNRERSADVGEQGTRDVHNLLRLADNWVTDDDPGFVDLASGDLRLREDAPVFDRIPGFADIPFERIGTHGPIGTGD